ncbi:PREDICTED: uncharacterized protein LOC108538210 [Rhinopithecus bieti]|uniref:uncharacterized protein LOC108538210 n=1 Tax=Rhinopithecus bieti TaxID=61621 RepID=UPI00083C015C|nr:PREDICTED: uncharacterized protein LOC108538210 [Rhinopithecus bieti]
MQPGTSQAKVQALTSGPYMGQDGSRLENLHSAEEETEAQTWMEGICPRPFGLLGQDPSPSPVAGRGSHATPATPIILHARHRPRPSSPLAWSHPNGPGSGSFHPAAVTATEEHRDAFRASVLQAKGDFPEHSHSPYPRVWIPRKDRPGSLDQDTNSSGSLKTMEAGESREIPSTGEVGSLRQAQNCFSRQGVPCAPSESTACRQSPDISGRPLRPSCQSPLLPLPSVIPSARWESLVPS